MNSYKIKVNNEAESKEAQELFFELGYHWYYNGKQRIENITGMINSGEDMSLTSGNMFNDKHKEITLQELRAMVNQDQGEPFLTPECTLNDQYAEIEKVRQDMINSPNYYADSAIECIDAMKAMMTHEQFVGYLRGNVFKYLWRYQKKNGAEDLKKSNWYLQKLIENTI